MGCGCTKKSYSISSNCDCNCGCDPECPTIATALEVTNAWNIPACDASATLYIPCLTFVQIGSYISNPTYGTFRVTAFNSVGGQVTVVNDCLPQNEAPGTVVPIGTLFVFSGPPVQTVYDTWSPTLSATGAMTVTGQTIDQAEYYIQDSTLNFTFGARYTLGGVAGIGIYIPLPVTCVADSVQLGLICAAKQAGAVVAGGARWRVENVSPDRLVVFLFDASNWTLGANASVGIQGRCKIA